MFSTVLALCAVLIYSVSATENGTVEIKNAAQNNTAAAVASWTTQQPPAVKTTGKTHETTADVNTHVPDDKPLFVGEANSSIILQCPLINGTIQWYKNDKEITAADKLYVLFSTNGSLEVSKVGSDCYGDFVCSNGLHNETVTLWVKPFVFQPEKKFKNIIEGDPFVMECKAWGYPEVTLNWTHNEVPIVIDDRIIFKEGSLNSTLRIKYTEYTDEGMFECTAQNRFGNASVVMEMKVKDKLAALWPFLGICAEVAILCAIIFIFEKRRSKRLKAEEGREETDHLNTGNESKMSEDLRQRKQ